MKTTPVVAPPTSTTSATDSANLAKLRHLLEARHSHAGGLDPSAPVPLVVAPAAPAHDFELALQTVLELTAAAYVLVAFGLALLATDGREPLAVGENGPGLHIAFALTAAAIAGLSAALYSIPRGQGLRLWSLPLGWIHWVVINAGFLYPAWAFHTARVWTDEAWLTMFVISATLLVGGLVLLLVNLVESLLHAGDGPAPAVPTT